MIEDSVVGPLARLLLLMTTERCVHQLQRCSDGTATACAKQVTPTKPSTCSPRATSRCCCWISRFRSERASHCSTRSSIHDRHRDVKIGRASPWDPRVSTLLAKPIRRSSSSTRSRSGLANRRVAHPDAYVRTVTTRRDGTDEGVVSTPSRAWTCAPTAIRTPTIGLGKNAKASTRPG